MTREPVDLTLTAPRAVLPRGTETVLVVEDEPLAREMAVDLLRGLGYSVLEAASGEAALALARSGGCQVDLLITDLELSGMSGDVLADEVRIANPATRVLFVSGSPDCARALARGLNMLPKPFARAELAQRVRRSLDE